MHNSCPALKPSHSLLYSIYCVKPACDGKSAAALLLRDVSQIEEADVLSFDLTPDPAKSYSELEIHHRTPQVILVEEGRVLVPVAKEFGTDCVEFVPLSAGEAMVISPEVWHFGPTASGANSRIIVAFRQGTPKHDLEKRTLPTPVTLPQPS